MRITNMNTEQMQLLQEALKVASDAMKDAALGIVEDEISNFPIFIAHKEPVMLGEPLSTGIEKISDWKLRATTAEELLKIGVIEPDKAKIFVAGYKDFRTHACILAIFSAQDQSFIFYPYA